jgi:hypothetical protein
MVYILYFGRLLELEQLTIRTYSVHNLHGYFVAMRCRPMPAVRDLTRDGRRSSYDVSVHKLYNVFIPWIMRTQGTASKATITKQNSPGRLIFLQLAIVRNLRRFFGLPRVYTSFSRGIPVVERFPYLEQICNYLG